MALSGIQIYKLLPQTNCKECGFPTCLAFAMKLAAKQVELSLCPYVTEESKATLAESSAPPIRLITLKSNGGEVKAGNEVVMFRHEKTFYNKPGILVKFSAGLPAAELKKQVEAADRYATNYVGINLSLDGFMLEAADGKPAAFAEAVKTMRSATQRPLILAGKDAGVLQAGLEVLPNEAVMLHGADSGNWQAMAALAKEKKASLSVSAGSLEELAELTTKIQEAGVEDLVLNPVAENLGGWLTMGTQIRRLALKKNFRPLGYPVIAFPKTPAAASQVVAKYAGFVVLEAFSPGLVYPLLVLRQNIYTDPQKPIQVQPGVYEINTPKSESPVLVTTNFSITYFSVANEVEGSGLPAWLVVCDAEGMSVLTAWAAGKFDSERIARTLKTFNLADKVSRKRVVIPGAVAVLSGELEGDLPDWEIRVGPREAVDIPNFMKVAL